MYHEKVLPRRFSLNCNTIGFRQQTQKLRVNRVYENFIKYICICLWLQLFEFLLTWHFSFWMLLTTKCLLTNSSRTYWHQDECFWWGEDMLLTVTTVRWSVNFFQWWAPVIFASVGDINALLNVISCIRQEKTQNMWVYYPVICSIVVWQTC